VVYVLGYGIWLGTTLSRCSANIYVSKLRFAIVWLGQIQNLDTGHVYVLGLVSGSERLSESGEGN